MTYFHECRFREVCHRALTDGVREAAEKAANMTKGTQVFIRGEIQYREWEKDGQKKSITEILADKVEPFEARQATPRTDESLPASPELDDIPF